MAEVEAAEKAKMKAKVDAILAHGCNVFVNRQLIYDWPQQLLADAQCMGIEHADFDGVERLALVTGGDIVSTFDTPGQVQLGSAEVVEEMMIGEVRREGIASAADQGGWVGMALTRGRSPCLAPGPVRALQGRQQGRGVHDRAAGRLDARAG